MGFSRDGFSPLLGGVPQSGEGVVKQKEGSPSMFDNPSVPQSCGTAPLTGSKIFQFPKNWFSL